METVYTLLCANGAVAPLYIETSRNIASSRSLIDPRFGYVHRKIKGESRPGENGMLRALNYYRSKGWIKPISTIALCTYLASEFLPLFFLTTSLVVQDQESATKTQAIADWADKRSIVPFLLPSRTAHKADPCDAYAHGVVHRSANTELNRLASYGPVSFSEYLNAIVGAYRELKPATVKGYFLAIGLIGSLDPETTVNRLFSEGFHVKPRFEGLHLRQLEAYLDDLLERREHIPFTPYEFRFENPFFNLFYEKQLRYFELLRQNVFK
jgi:hypothetical protein